MKIKRLNGNKLPTPKRESQQAAGYDLRSNIDAVTVPPLGRVIIGTGFAWEIPEGFVGMIRPRSGLAVREGLDVMAGIVDSDYRGEVKVLLINLGDKPIKINYGDRVAQMVVMTHRTDELIEVDELNDVNRGGGFGSTGNK